MDSNKNHRTFYLLTAYLSLFLLQIATTLAPTSVLAQPAPGAEARCSEALNRCLDRVGGNAAAGAVCRHAYESCVQRATTKGSAYRNCMSQATSDSDKQQCRSKYMQ